MKYIYKLLFVILLNISSFIFWAYMATQFNKWWLSLFVLLTLFTTNSSNKED